jgi:hypothetical protein
MWATDLNVGPSLALASYQLFDFLSAGQFFPQHGKYLLNQPDESSSNATGGMNAESSSSQAAHEPYHNRQRFFVACELLQHPGLQNLDFGSFFRSCRAANKVFDMEERTGTTFALLDKPAAETIGVLSSGATLYDSVSQMARTLDFLQSSVLAASPGSSSPAFTATSTTLHYLTDCLRPAPL